MKKTRRSPAQIRQILAEYAISGLTQEEFARRHGVCKTTIQYWKRHHGSGVSARLPRLVEVKSPASLPASMLCRVELPGGVVINYDHRPDPNYLVELARQLQRP